jgi:hypothetical protein
MTSRIFLLPLNVFPNAFILSSQNLRPFPSPKSVETLLWTNRFYLNLQKCSLIFFQEVTLVKGTLVTLPHLIQLPKRTGWIYRLTFKKCNLLKKCLPFSRVKLNPSFESDEKRSMDKKLF